MNTPHMQPDEYRSAPHLTATRDTQRHQPNEIAVLSDIHSNHTALTAVLNDIPDSVDMIVCLGDVIGYGPHPKECLDTIQSTADILIQGNHDRSVTTPEKYSANHMAHQGLKHSRHELSNAAIDWLQSHPERTSLNDYYFCHSHPEPEHNDKYVHPRNFPEIVPFSRKHNADIVALGHTHRQGSLDLSQFDDRAGVVFNPGSVGQPRDNDPDAAYAVIDTATNNIDFHRVPYDIESVQEAIRSIGLPEKTAARLATGD